MAPLHPALRLQPLRHLHLRRQLPRGRLRQQAVPAAGLSEGAEGQAGQTGVLHGGYSSHGISATYAVLYTSYIYSFSQIKVVIGCVN